MTTTNRKLFSIILMIVLMLNMSLASFASTVEISSTSVSSIKSNIVVTNSGVYINDEYFSQNEFRTLLEKAIPVNSKSTYNSYGSNDLSVRSASAASLAGGLVAGTWWIPGIGEVVITVAGVIIIGGAVIATGTWLYNEVVDWFEAKAEAEDYEEAKDRGTKTDNHERVTDKSSLPTKGAPHSSKDLIDSKGVKQRRYYDKNGNADEDIDYHHGGTGHDFPHRHYWNNGRRGPERPF